MADTPENTSDPSKDDSAEIGQADIDALMSGADAESSAADSQDATQDDIDALIADPGSSGAGASAVSDDSSESGSVSQDDIDALLAGDAPPAAASADAGAEADADLGGVSQSDIDALLNGGGADATGETDASAGEAPAADPAPAAEPDSRVDTLGRPFDEAAAAMAAAIAEEAPPAAAAAPTAAAPVAAKPVELQELDTAGAEGIDANRVTMLSEVKLRVKIQLGRTRMLVEDVLKLGEGSVVELDKLAGDPVNVLVNDRLIARGEVLVLNDSFCVRISEVLSHDPHRVTT